MKGCVSKLADADKGEKKIIITFRLLDNGIRSWKN